MMWSNIGEDPCHVRYVRHRLFAYLAYLASAAARFSARTLAASAAFFSASSNLATLYTPLVSEIACDGHT